MDEKQIKDARILLVEDDENHLLLLKSVLHHESFENVQVAPDEHHVLDLCLSCKPDLIVLDWQLPQRSGLDILKEVRAWAGTGHDLPVLVLTADPRRTSRYDALRAGASDFVSKPFDHEELLLRINSLLELHFLHREVQEENQRLEERVQERTRELMLAQMEFLERLAAAAELRDDLTGQHTARVGMVSALIAETLGLPEGEVRTIRQAAPLHDVGKLAVPEVILRKPARLTTEEFEVMKTHTVYGPRLLTGDGNGDFPLLKSAEEIAATHHERWDGTGYPAMLSGEAIPLAGRIVAVADVYDAFTHQRPYKPAWPRKESLREIRAETGLHFDPLVVDAFVELEESGRLRDELHGLERGSAQFAG
ncbi:MAG: HD domain-containing phosphohydrolase [Candidatus Sumerlaeaceae bacterium]